MKKHKVYLQELSAEFSEAELEQLKKAEFNR